MDELKPCPFCGGSNTIKRSSRYSNQVYHECNECGCSVAFYSEERDFWNTRPAEDAKDKEIEKLKAALRGIVVLCDGYNNSRRRKEDINHTIHWVRKLAKDSIKSNNTDVLAKESEGKDE